MLDLADAGEAAEYGNDEEYKFHFNPSVAHCNPISWLAFITAQRDFEW